MLIMVVSAGAAPSSLAAVIVGTVDTHVAQVGVLLASPTVTGATHPSHPLLASTSPSWWHQLDRGRDWETVRSYLKKVQSKLTALNRAHAVAEAIRQQLIP
jgi:hypothetical protein